MITKLTLKNFKSIQQETYQFTQFDLLVGPNNSGKSSILQALAIWQFCVDEFRQSSRRGSKGIQIVLPNFTALPVPEFNLLWKDKTDRYWPMANGKKKQEYILIDIMVEWQCQNGEQDSFGVQLRYQSPQTIYAIPVGGWDKFRQCEQQNNLPIIAYVPPFSGLDPNEKWLDTSPIRQQVGKGQPGSVLRNLLLRVCPDSAKSTDSKTGKPELLKDWREIHEVIKNWFSVSLREPQYNSGRDVYITVEYRQNDRDFDIISGGSGFHQTLTLLAFLYGYKPTTVLLDEPDAHLHVNLQREILDYFKRKSIERDTQFLIATHAEEFVSGVDHSQIYSLLQHRPTRIQSSAEILRAMADVTNQEITFLKAFPTVIYVEGESDQRIIRAWAEPCAVRSIISLLYFKCMGGGNKQEMKDKADRHFNALKQIIPDISRLMLFDYDLSQNSFHPGTENPTLVEWERKNIENYLLVPEAWKRAVLKQRQCSNDPLFAQPVLQIIDDFFAEQNLTLPKGKTWRNLTANIFQLVDGKRILFENEDSLFQRIQKHALSLQILREQVAMSMLPEEIHENVHQFMQRLSFVVNTRNSGL